MILYDGSVEKDRGGDNLFFFFYSEFHPETILKKGILIIKSQGLFCLYGINRAVCTTKSLITWADTVQWNTILTNAHYSISRVIRAPVIKISGVCCTVFKNHYFMLNMNIHFQWQSKSYLTSLRKIFMCSNIIAVIRSFRYLNSDVYWKYFRWGSFHHPAPKPWFIHCSKPCEWVSPLQSVKFFSVQNLIPFFFQCWISKWQRQWGKSRKSPILLWSELDSISVAL